MKSTLNNESVHLHIYHIREGQFIWTIDISIYTPTPVMLHLWKDISQKIPLRKCKPDHLFPG